MAAWELWERALVPSLLSGCGTWMGITSTEEDRLDRLQDLFWRVMLKVPESCPRIALSAETRMMDMKHRIWQEKLLLLRRIKHQSMETLSRKIYEEQKANEWPGLCKEVTEICKHLEICDINDDDIPPQAIKKAIFDHHYLELKAKVAKSKKMLQHKDDDFTEVQEYMKGKSIENCRMSFKIRCEMVQDIKGNFKDKFRRKGGEEALSCKVCGDIESQSYCLVCHQWRDINSGDLMWTS